MKEIVILIPGYNEEEGVGKVIDGIPIRKLEKLGYTARIIVIDNNSSDKTAEKARKHGANNVTKQYNLSREISLAFYFPEVSSSMAFW